MLPVVLDRGSHCFLGECCQVDLLNWSFEIPIIYRECRKCIFSSRKLKLIFSFPPTPFLYFSLSREIDISLHLLTPVRSHSQYIPFTALSCLVSYQSLPLFSLKYDLNLLVAPHLQGCWLYPVSISFLISLSYLQPISLQIQASETEVRPRLTFFSSKTKKDSQLLSFA